MDKKSPNKDGKIQQLITQHRGRKSDHQIRMENLKD
jgi:hypothetical protein